MDSKAKSIAIIWWKGRTNIGAVQGRSVIDAISRHAHGVVVLLQLLHDLVLVLGEHWHRRQTDDTASQADDNESESVTEPQEGQR